jgi:glutamyl/glutaminyl-tRNA synthetase
LLSTTTYRGRLAPSPTGFLHLGHARTFWVAWQRARAARGQLVFRNEDLDPQRSKPEFVAAMYEDLRWLGLDWDEGPGLPPQSGKTGQPGDPGLPPQSGKTGQPGDPGIGGPFGPYSQSQRRNFYLNSWLKLRDGGFIYPCTCSRKDLERALEAPHEDDDEVPYPGTCRSQLDKARNWDSPAGISWRFQVPDEEDLVFGDGYFGKQRFTPGRDFSDFLVWRRDDLPAYQLAVVVDDAAMQISEVVRGADLLKSTARQLLLFRALKLEPPQYFHCPLLRDEHNVRLAKRHDSLSLRRLRAQGTVPEDLRKKFADEFDWQLGLTNSSN